MKSFACLPQRFQTVSAWVLTSSLSTCFKSDKSSLSANNPVQLKSYKQQLMRTTANDIHSKSVFELSAEELSERLKPTADALKRETLARNGYLTYFDHAICPDTNYTVHEYRDKKVRNLGVLLKVIKNG